MRSLLRDRDGVTAVEFGFVLGPLLMLLMGIVKIGEVVWVQNVLNYSVDEAARCGAVDPTICATSSQTQTFAASAAGSGIAATYVATSATTQSCVTAAYTVAISAPFLHVNIPLSANACYPK